MGEGTAIGLTTLQMSWIDGSHLTAYAIGQFVWGICGDKLGTRRVVLAGMLASVAAALAMGASTLAASILLAGLLLLPKWNALPPTAGDAKGKAYEEEG